MRKFFVIIVKRGPGERDPAKIKVLVATIEADSYAKAWRHARYALDEKEGYQGLLQNEAGQVLVPDKKFSYHVTTIDDGIPRR